MLGQKDMCAPKGKFRVIGVDTFDGTDWIEGDFDSEDEAFDASRKKGSTMLKTHVYDDKGNHLHSDGTF